MTENAEGEYYEIRITLRSAFAAAARNGTAEKMLWPLYRILIAENMRLENHLGRTLASCARNLDHPAMPEVYRFINQEGVRDRMNDTFVVVPQSDMPMKGEQYARVFELMESPSLDRYICARNGIHCKTLPKRPDLRPVP